MLQLTAKGLLQLAAYKYIIYYIDDNYWQWFGGITRRNSRPKTVIIKIATIKAWNDEHRRMIK